MSLNATELEVQTNTQRTNGAEGGEGGGRGEAGVEEAGRQIAQLSAELNKAREELSLARQTLTRLERKRQIDALLADSDTIDVEAARLLTEAAMEQMSEPDIKMAIEDLRRHKPYLFRRRNLGAAAQSMPARQREGQGAGVSQAAGQAKVSGDRRDLLRYLRLRRQS